MPHSKSFSIDRLKDIKLQEISPEEAINSAKSHSTPSPSSDDKNDNSSDSNSSDPHKYLPSGSTLLQILAGLQKYSSFAFVGFLGLHLTAVVVVPAFSYEAGNQALMFTNAIYQNPAVEPILITGSLLTHILSGMTLRIYRLVRSKNLYERWLSPISKLNPVSVAGYLALPMVCSHYYLTRWLPKHVLGDSSLISLDYIANSLADHPLLATTSMLSMLSLVLYHSIWGCKKWLKAVTKPRFKSITTGFITAGIVLGVSSLFRISSNGPATGWLASQYKLISDASLI